MTVITKAVSEKKYNLPQPILTIHNSTDAEKYAEKIVANAWP